MDDDNVYYADPDNEELDPEAATESRPTAPSTWQILTIRLPGKNKRLFKRNLARTCLVTFKCE